LILPLKFNRLLSASSSVYVIVDEDEALPLRKLLLLFPPDEEDAVAPQEVSKNATVVVNFAIVSK